MTGERRTVVAHSLTTWVLLRLFTGSTPPRMDRILLAAPVSRQTLAANPPIAAFDPLVGDDAIADAVTSHGGVHVVCSGDDPYFVGGAAGWAESLGATVHPLTGQGHLAVGDGYGRWDSVRDWVLGASDQIIQPR
jgi:predicted alpha/beta hydrolase family esterase